jgi:predicted ATPase/Tfp pilus assembly protein PilF
VAQTLLGDYADGVFFVPLAAVADPNRVIPAIALALDLADETGAGRPVAQLRAHLRERRILLVLDNFEQVVAAAPELTGLMSAAPGLSLLVTSREVLRVYGEQEYPVPPLPLPVADQTPTVTDAAAYAALALFESRAQAVDPPFRLTPENVGDVARICRLLDGLPLAIELAAARVKLLSPAALLARLGGDPGSTGTLKVLRGRARDLPPRQQTLRGAIDWSFALLDPAEKQLFTRLGVFVGARTVAAVEAVCDLDGDLSIDALEGLASLVDKSLLRQREGADGEPAFYMLTTIHEYCQERLVAGGELPLLRRRHAYFFANLVETAEPRLQGGEQPLWLDVLELNHDNIRAALSWALESGDSELGCRFSAALWRFWRVRGYIREGRERTAAVLARAGGIKNTRAFARAVLAAGHLAYLQSDFQAAAPLYAEAHERLTLLGEEALVGQVLHNIGLLAFKQGDVDEARRYYEQSLEALHRAADEVNIASVLNSLGNLAWLARDFRAARHYYGLSSERWRALGNKQNTAMVANNLGAVAMTTGDYQSAAQIFTDCLLIHRELRNQNGVALALSNLSEIALEQREYERARAYLAEALIIQRELARKERIAILLEGFGRLAARQAQARRAALLFGAAEQLREVIRAPRPEIVAAQVEPDLAHARSLLGEGPFAAALAQGRRLDQAAAVALALEEAAGAAR